MDSRFVRAYPPEAPAPGPALYFAFRGGDLLVQDEEKGVRLPGALPAGLQTSEPLYLGTLDGVPCLACEVGADTPLPAGWRAAPLRSLFGALDDATYGVAGYASQILYWLRTSRYCGVCGQLAEQPSGDWGRRCPACGHARYPGVHPAILVLVHDGDRVLLAHKPGWGSRYSILAGFTEPGESLEDCVHRETYEETGITLTDLVYAGSQPWPYPSQLMIGYTARYAGGEIKVDGKELDHAAWFTPDSLPDLPPPLSLSRQIIDAWITTRTGNSGTIRHGFNT